MRKKFLLAASVLLVGLCSACNMTEEQIDDALKQVEESMNKDDSKGGDAPEETGGKKEENNKEDMGNTGSTSEEAAPTSTPAPTATNTLAPTATNTPTPTPVPRVESPKEYFTWYVDGDHIVLDGLTDLGGENAIDIVIPSEIGGKPVTALEGTFFRKGTSLRSVDLPDCITFIGSDVFNGCSELTSINIPDGVTWIDSSAFEGCTKLTNLTIPDGVTWIGSSAFEGCSSLNNIYLPDSLNEIATNAFQGCTSLTAVSAGTGYAEDWAIENGYIEDYRLDFNVMEGTYWYGKDCSDVLFFKDNVMYINGEAGPEYSITYGNPNIYEAFVSLDAKYEIGYGYSAEVNGDYATNNMSMYMFGFMDGYEMSGGTTGRFEQCSEAMYNRVLNAEPITPENINETYWSSEMMGKDIYFKDGIATVITTYDETQTELLYVFNEENQIVIENLLWDGATFLLVGDTMRLECYEGDVGNEYSSTAFMNVTEN